MQGRIAFCRNCVFGALRQVSAGAASPDRQTDYHKSSDSVVPGSPASMACAICREAIPACQHSRTSKIVI